MKTKKNLFRKNRTLPVAVVVAGVAIVAGLGEAAACPVCFSANESSRSAFLLTTIAMSALPLGMFAALGLFIRHRVKAVEVENSDGGR